jgi:hypothetical protein
MELESQSQQFTQSPWSDRAAQIVKPPDLCPYVSNSYHFHGTVRCPGHPIVDKWRASRAKIQGLYNPDVAFI